MKYNELKKTCLCTLILLALVNVIYFNSLCNSFHFDDSASITENYNLKDINYLSELFTDLNSILSHRPIVQTSLLFNYRFSHLNVFGYHLFNVTIHCLVVITFFYVTKYLMHFSPYPLTGNGAKISHGYFFPFIASMVLGIHPIFTESVVYISSRSSILLALFFLLTFYYLMKAQVLRNRTIPVITAIIFFSLGMATKKNFAVLPLFFLLYLLCFHWDYLKRKIIEHRITVSLLAFAFLSFAFYKIASEGSGLLFLGPIEKQWTPYQYLLTEFNVILFYYLKKLVFPFALSIDPLFPVSNSIFSLSSLSLFVICVLLFYSFKIRNKVPFFCFGIFWFFLTILPSSSIIPLLDFVSEHRLYLPALGIILAMAPLAKNYYGKCAHIFFLVILLSTLSIQRNFDWKNAYSIWSDAVENSPKKARPHFNLAKYYQGAKMYDEAIAEYKIASKLSPKVYFPYIGMGMVYLELKKYDMAEVSFNMALKRKPNEFEPISKLAQVRFKKGDFEKAEELLTQKGIPDDQADAFYLLGRIYSMKNRTGLALEQFHKAIRANPDFAQSYVGLGIIYAKEGKPQLSEKYFKKSINVFKNNPGAYFNLGYLYFMQKKYEEAIENYHKALEFDPDMNRAWVNMGDSYFALKKYGKAFESYENVVGESELSHEAIFKSGQCKLASEGLKSADEYYSTFRFDKKSDCDLYLRIGKLFEKNRNEDLAMKYYEIAQKLDPERIKIDYHDKF